ncbi:DUF547 domain-containing protein [Maricaulis sp.]|uniref:DUF547 domain-containing protein n=1 Tax=Maricaulis sp. TaxID=1486257 RepID=UPI001B0630A4|nr:DUF547 domain-containing protein [Maricaulis sp.]MBO6764804.1 DUF547 domain-containing protein [Maricaulis sp.]
MKRALLVGLSAVLLGTTSAAAQVSSSELARFSRYDDNSSRHVDYEIWTDLLYDIVLNVPVMDREPERLRAVNTGTRISTANESRYRFEANRVAYHLMSDEYQEAISAYRQDLESLPGHVDLATLSSNEQLAYWLNLHNVAVIEQIMLNYPLTRVNRQEAYGTNENLFEAKILNIAGVPLSLNDIRLRIVYRQWDDPRVIYGFFNGAIGGPEISRTAFDGDSVWTQLDRNAEEFINSLRGVEVARRELRVSHLYEEAAHFFPDFDNDLRAHLSVFANADTAEQLAPGRPVYATIEDWHIADLINGSTRCVGPGGAATMYSGSPDPSSGIVAAGTSCSTALPSNALVLLNAVQERRIELMREGRYGEVYTVDIPTDENGNELRLEPTEIDSPDDSE